MTASRLPIGLVHAEIQGLSEGRQLVKILAPRSLLDITLKVACMLCCMDAQGTQKANKWSLLASYQLLFTANG